MPVSSLKYVVVIPSGGGKTTLSEDPIFLDIDYFYNLRETQSTYDRIELELQERSISKKPIGLKVSNPRDIIFLLVWHSWMSFYNIESSENMDNPCL